MCVVAVHARVNELVHTTYLGILGRKVGPRTCSVRCSFSLWAPALIQFIVKLIVIGTYYIHAGELGVVYRGLLLSESKKIPEAVAVKTLKGQLYVQVL